MLRDRSMRQVIARSTEQRLLDGGAVPKGDVISSDGIAAITAADRWGKPLGIAQVGEALGADVVIYASIDSFALSADRPPSPTGTARQGHRCRLIQPSLARRRAGWGRVATAVRARRNAANIPLRNLRGRVRLAQIGNDLANLFVKHEKTALHENRSAADDRPRGIPRCPSLNRRRPLKPQRPPPARTDRRRDAVIACRASISQRRPRRIIGATPTPDSHGARRVSDRITPMLRARPPFAGPPISSTIATGRPRPWHPDLIMCWSIGCMGLSRLIVGKRGVMRCGLLLRDRLAPRRGTLAFRREAYALADVTTVALSERIRAAHAQAASVGRGGTFLKDNIRLFDPPIPPTRPALSGSRPTSAVGSASPTTTVAPPRRSAALAPGDSPFLGLLYVGHQRVSGLIPSGCQRSAARPRRSRPTLGLSSLPTSAQTRSPSPTRAIVLPASDSGSACSLQQVRAPSPRGSPRVRPSSPLMPRSIASRPDAAQPPLSAHCSPRLRRQPAQPPRRPALHDPALFPISAILGSPALRPYARPTPRADLLALWREIANVPIIRPGLPVPPSLTKTSLAAAS